MRHHQERPETRLERYVAIAGIVVSLVAGDRLILSVVRGPDLIHTWRFMGLGLILALVVYLGWLLWALSTVRYIMAAERFVLGQGRRTIVIDLGRGAQLYRWRVRWGWNGAAQRDLDVEEVAMMPPFWLWQGPAVYVLRYSDEQGEQRAVALRPSPQLLSLLREHLRIGGPSKTA